MLRDWPKSRLHSLNSSIISLVFINDRSGDELRHDAFAGADIFNVSRQTWMYADNYTQIRPPPILKTTPAKGPSTNAYLEDYRVDSLRGSFLLVTQLASNLYATYC